MLTGVGGDATWREERDTNTLRGPLKISRIPFQKRRLVSLGGATRRDQLAHLVKPLEILLIRKKKICVYQMLVAYMIPQEQKDGNGKVSRSSVSWLLLMYVHLPE